MNKYTECKKKKKIFMNTTFTIIHQQLNSNAYVTYLTISGRNCRSPERRRISNSPGSRAYFLLEMYPVTFWTVLGRCSSKTSDQKSPGAPVSKLTGVVRSPVNIGAGAFRVLVGN